MAWRRTLGTLVLLALSSVATADGHFLADDVRPGAVSATVRISVTIPPPARSPARIRECADSLGEGTFRVLSKRCAQDFEVAAVTAEHTDDGHVVIAPI